jgi:hypothetical protein
MGTLCSIATGVYRHEMLGHCCCFQRGQRHTTQVLLRRRFILKRDVHANEGGHCTNSGTPQLPATCAFGCRLCVWQPGGDFGCNRRKSSVVCVSDHQTAAPTMPATCLCQVHDIRGSHAHVCCFGLCTEANTIYCCSLPGVLQV